MSQGSVGFTYQRRDALFRHILYALDEMPAELREVFMLRHYEHLSVEEMASRMSLDATGLAELLERANGIFFKNLHDCDRA
jgi:DNA-directed RNA polymerase specialized sigma24 family protein